MKKYIAGVDIGNATTEVALGLVEDNEIKAIHSGIARTTGLKGTDKNISGIIIALEQACTKIGIALSGIGEIRLNEATPVIGDFAMETITETVITESTMIGHNPDTPGGLGLGIGISVQLNDVFKAHASDTADRNYIVIVDGKTSFKQAAAKINEALKEKINITGAIVQKDDGVLIANRINKNMPIVDEVRYIDKVPEGMLCAVEVAAKGMSVETLSNPYGLANIFDLSDEETKNIIFVAKALIGTRSAVVLKTPHGEVRERIIPAGEITFCGKERQKTVSVEAGAEVIMDKRKKSGILKDVKGSPGTNIGGMISSIKNKMSVITHQNKDKIFIQDIMAVDTIVPQGITGAMANEYTMEKSVAIAAMVKTSRLNMERLAENLTAKTGINVLIGGIEGDMAALGALTTPGTKSPILVVDIGAGSTDACYFESAEKKTTIHLAGAGDMVSALIKSELGLNSFEEAENIKKYRLAKVENLFNIKYEDGSVDFFRQPLPSELFAKVVTVREDGLFPLDTKHNMEKIRRIRREAKRKVLIENVIRALTEVSPTGELNGISHLVLLGGSSLDFEFANMLTEQLSYYGITAGKAQVRGCEGPRNAVATGLLLSALK